MPAIFTHLRFGEEVAKSLSPNLARLTATHKECFALGTQGPDLLFFHKPFSKNAPRQKGWDLHAVPPEDFFLEGAKSVLAEEENYEDGRFVPRSPAAAYLLGFLCHFCLDTTCHPYIDENSVNGLTHGKIESELDKYHFRKMNMPPRGYNAAKRFFPAKKVTAASAKILGVTEKNTLTAVKSMRFFNAFFSHKCGFIHGCCHTGLTLLGLNKKFGDMFIHKKYDPRCLPLYPTLDEKFNEAKERARAVIEEFFQTAQSSVQTGTLTNEIFRYNYSGIKGE